MGWRALVALDPVQRLDLRGSDPAHTVDELLPASAGSAVLFDLMFDKFESWAELVVQGISVVARDVEATALLWSFQAERRNNDVATGSYCLSHLVNVGPTLIWIRQEVEDRAVVPEVVAAGLECVGCDVPS